jgi:mono/diheme cytochrome c family protein
MKRKITGPILLSLTALSLMFSGCGGTSSSAVTPAVTGVAAAGSPLVGTAYLKDSSAKELTATIKSDGSYTFDVTGMQGPFILEATGTVGTTSYTLHSFATGPGTANINPMSNVMVASAAGGTDPAQIFASPSLSVLQGIATNMPAADSALMTSLKPLMTLYGATADPISGQFVANHTGLDAMLDAVTMTFSAGTITVMNTSTNTMIFTAQATNVGGGIFTMANMPLAPTTTTMMPTTTTTTTPAFDGAAYYTANCASCHGALATSSKLGATATQIQTGISGNMSGMGQFSTLTAAQVQAIATALNPTASTTITTTMPTTTTTMPTTTTTMPTTTTTAPTTTTTAPTTTTTMPTTTTTMPTMTTTTPTTTTTTPTFDGAAYYTANCAGCHGPIATSAFHGATATMIQTGISSNMGGMGKFSSLTAAQIQAISTALQ